MTNNTRSIKLKFTQNLNLAQERFLYSSYSPVWRGTLVPLLLAVFPRLEGDVGQQLLVHEAPEPDGVVPGDLLNGRSQILAQPATRGKYFA